MSNLFFEGVHMLMYEEGSILSFYGSGDVCGGGVITKKTS